MQFKKNYIRYMTRKEEDNMEALSTMLLVFMSLLILIGMFKYA